MKNNANNSNTNNIDHGNFTVDAQAVSESELLPIYDGMRFSGDIQPLEDVNIGNYEKQLLTEENSDSQKSDTKKKKRSIFSNSDKKKKRTVIAVLSSVAALALVVTAIVLIAFNAENDSPVKAVYVSGGVHEILLDNGDTYTIPKADDIKVTADGMTLYYSVTSDSKTGKFDIKVIDVSKKKELKNEGTYIDNSINEDWQINADGSFMYYSKTDDGGTDLYIYSKADKKTTLLSENAKEIFRPLTGDVVYFTKKTNGINTLYRMRYGEEATGVANNISQIYCYETAENFEILYAVDTGVETTVDVYSVKGLEEPKLICESASGVNFEDYSIGGNLYYFTKDTASIDWHDIIDDPYFESDADMEEPVESDFVKSYGSLFGVSITRLDRNAYENAKKKYEAKAFRDKIREELDNINLGLAVENLYSCHVYTNGRSKTLSTGVQLENILAFSSDGAPRFVFAKSTLQVENKVKMDTLIDFAQKENVARAIDHVVETVGESEGLSNECVYSWYDSTRVYNMTLTEYDVEKTTFVTGTKDYLYAVSDGVLYYNNVTTKEIEARQYVDENVASAEFIEGYLYYTKRDEYGEDSLYRYSPESGSQYLAKNLYDYFVLEKEYVLLLSKQDAETDLMDIAVFKDGEYLEIDTDVSLNDFVYNGKTIAYVKNIGSYETYDAGDLYTFTAEEGVMKIKENVTEIFYTSKS